MYKNKMHTKYSRFTVTISFHHQDELKELVATEHSKLPAPVKPSTSDATAEALAKATGPDTAPDSDKESAKPAATRADDTKPTNADTSSTEPAAASADGTKSTVSCADSSKAEKTEGSGEAEKVEDSSEAEKVEASSDKDECHAKTEKTGLEDAPQASKTDSTPDDHDAPGSQATAQDDDSAEDKASKASLWKDEVKTGHVHTLHHTHRKRLTPQ